MTDFKKGMAFVDVRRNWRDMPVDQRWRAQQHPEDIPPAQSTWHLVSDPYWNAAAEEHVIDVVVFVAGKPTQRMPMSLKELDEYIEQHNCQLLEDSYPEEK